MQDGRRDPRKDPRPGDITRYVAGVALVVRVTSDEVYWAVADQQRDGLYRMDKDQWISRSKDDEVLHAEE